ncbi:hypothetical protein WPS_33740 [Vulcanimicrobium alpinum]|uniref:Uncharacterized protein n=1 Tax=Vulcanimicrobium alpinum TaxID=3016050 RepID=A0AAN2CBJ5_UNVUL|nr:hypothetical protein [Vulcanimicrobium alpinum]BDE08098.1 hypothetical protein WPS_33740 [Vulcanimicrobium alpinum]
MFADAARPEARFNAALAGMLGAIAALLFSHGRLTPYDNYVLLADAMLHGRLWIDPQWPGPQIDAVLADGHRYIVNDPVPALLILPLVALVGTRANETLLACLLCGVATGAAWALLERLGVTSRVAIWLIVFLLAGTDLLWCSMLGDVWFVAQTSAVAFTLLALCELAGARRGLLVAVFFALALGSRFTLVMALPVIAWWVWDGFLARERRPRALNAFALTLVPFFMLWIAYNEARWHVPWDAGHTIFYHQDPFMGSPAGSPFGIGNVPVELWSFFVAWPLWHAQAPYLEPLTSGTALWFTSPALLLALVARTPRLLVLALWCATLLVALPSLLYYANGGAQFGMRHALDFEPFLLALMGLAARDGLAAGWRVLIAWSAAAGVWGCWYWNTFLRPGNL